MSFWVNCSCRYFHSFWLGAALLLAFARRSIAAMPFVQYPVDDQGATFISLAAILAASPGRGVAASQAQGSAASQGLLRLEELNCEALPADLDLDMVGFVLATRQQVETLGFMEEFNIGLAISCTGQGTKPFQYRRQASSRGAFEKANVPVSWVRGRLSALNIVLPYCVSALAKKQCVLVHCNQSFHRAPLGFAMLARLLFGCEPSDVLQLLGETRSIYYQYEPGKEFVGAQMWESLQWAKQLQMWQPRSSSPMLPSAWGNRSQGAAASSGQGAAASSGQGVAASQGQGAAASSGQGSAASQGPPAKRSKSSVFQVQDEYLYRAMTLNLTEFQKKPSAAPTEKGLDLAVLILDAVEKGSQRQSPFLHFSLEFWEARKWQSRAKKERGESGTVLCRVHREALKKVAASQGVEGPPDLEKGLQVGEVLDLSTTEKTKKWLAKYAGEDAVQDRLATLRRSHACSEVAVAWRFHLSRELFEVLDEVGNPQYFLSDGRFLQRACSKRAQLLGSENGCCISF